MGRQLHGELVRLSKEAVVVASLRILSWNSPGETEK
jgi:hypothetical protein